MSEEKSPESAENIDIGATIKTIEDATATFDGKFKEILRSPGNKLKLKEALTNFGIKIFEIHTQIASLEKADLDASEVK